MQCFIVLWAFDLPVNFSVVSKDGTVCVMGLDVRNVIDIYRRNSGGSRVKPWGTPKEIGRHSDVLLGVFLSQCHHL